MIPGLASPSQLASGNHFQYNLGSPASSASFKQNTLSSNKGQVFNFKNVQGDNGGGGGGGVTGDN